MTETQQNKRRAIVAVVASAAVGVALILLTHVAPYKVYLPMIQMGEARKAGAATPWQRTMNCQASVALNTSWAYNWGPTNKDNCETVEFVPMVWGKITSVPVLTDNSQWLLPFNEPNYSGQAVMTPAQAVAMWSFLEATGRKLTTPAVSACENPNNPLCLNNHWLEQFMTACVGCRIDALALHYYSCSVNDLRNYLAYRHAQYPSLPIWLTEFGCPTYAGDPVAFMRDAIPMLDSLSYVKRYAAFAVDTTGFSDFLSLTDGNGNLTTLGQVYAGL